MKQEEPLTLQAETTTGSLKADADPVLTFTISLPRVVADDRRNRKISNHYLFLRRRVNHLVRYPLFHAAQKHRRRAMAENAPFIPYVFEMDYTETMNDGAFLSLYYDRYVTVEGQRRCVLRGADTWELSPGTPLSCAHFFPGIPHVNQYILDEILSMARAHTAMGLAFYYEDLRKSFKRHFNMDQFYISDNGLSFFFQPNTIAPEKQGVPVFTIPKEKLGFFPVRNSEEAIQAIS